MSIQELIYKTTQILEDNSNQWIKDHQILYDNPEIKCYYTNKKLSKIYYIETIIQNPNLQLPQLTNLYLSSNKSIQKIDKNVYLNSSEQKLSPYTPIYMKTHEIINFKQLDQKIYIIHLMNPKQSKSGLNIYNNIWDLVFYYLIQYVEQISLVENNLIYRLIIVVKSNLSTFHYKLLNNFLKIQSQSFVKILQNSQKKCNQKKRKIAKINDQQDGSFDRQHLRLLKLNDRQKKIFSDMKKKFPQATDNELCRFLKAKNFCLEESIQMYDSYLKWKKSMEKYTLQHFSIFHRQKFFSLIGKDKKGYPIVLVKPSRIYPEQIKDEQFYCLYILYFFQIYVPSQMNGYVDQIKIIANVQDSLGVDNFKLSLSIKNIEYINKYCPQRQLKIIIINTNSFATLTWVILKNILPKHLIQKIQILGTDADEIKNVLAFEMDNKIIANYFRDGNKHLEYFDIV